MWESSEALIQPMPVFECQSVWVMPLQCQYLSLRVVQRTPPQSHSLSLRCPTGWMSVCFICLGATGCPPGVFSTHFPTRTLRFVSLTQVWQVHRNKGGFSLNWPNLNTVVINSISNPLFLSMFECVTMHWALTFPWVTHLITATLLLMSNSVGRSCQISYAEPRGDFESLLMTQQYNYPVYFTPTYSFFSSPLLSFSLSLLFFLVRSPDLLIRKYIKQRGVEMMVCSSFV